jgi:hypothetical protein
MYYLVTVEHNSMAVHLTSSFKQCCISSAVDGTDNDMLWKGREGNGMEMLGVSVRKMKALTVKMETVTLSGKGR